jgi:hypothetical protein
MVADNAGRTFQNPHLRRQTEGAFAMLDLIADPRNGAPMHVHKNEDEHFIVLEGTLHIANGDKTLDASGHGSHRQKGRSACLVQSVGDSPPNAARFFTWAHRATFREVAARENDDIAAILDKFGCLIVRPALLEGVYSISSPRDMT